MKPRRKIIPLAQQLQRSAELDAIRLARKLTAEEQAEADRLADRAYMRAWRANQAEVERRLAGAIR
jgi:hypothetical protein